MIINLRFPVNVMVPDIFTRKCFSISKVVIKTVKGAIFPSGEKYYKGFLCIGGVEGGGSGLERGPGYIRFTGCNFLSQCSCCFIYLSVFGTSQEKKVFDLCEIIFKCFAPSLLELVKLNKV